MPKRGMEPVRRQVLIDATIRAIHAEGYCGVTIGAIARQAGVSTGLAHHYFGSKEQLLAATMRALLARLGADIRLRLAAAAGPEARLRAIIRGNLDRGQLVPEVVSAWLAFYMLAQHAPAAQHLLQLYYRRLNSNLVHALRPLIGAAAPAVASDLGALIDGYYLRHVLDRPGEDAEAAIARIEACLALHLGRESLT